jgi:hypothetical protein
MGRVWSSAVAFAARSQRNRQAERHKRCNELPLQFPRSQFPRESKHAKTSLGCDERLQSLKFDSARDIERAFVINSTRFPFFEYCPCTEHTVENCGTPTLRFSEAVDFAIPFCLRHLVAWPATVQIILKNDAKSSLFELLRDMFSKNFQSSMPFVSFLMFISFRQCGITGCIKFPLYGMRRLYVDMAHVNQFYNDIFSV